MEISVNAWDERQSAALLIKISICPNAAEALATVSLTSVSWLTSQQIADEFLVIPLYQNEEYFSEYRKLRRLEMENGSRLKIMSVFYAILDRLMNEPKTKNPYMNRAVQYILAHLMDPALSNDRIALELGISEVYLRRLFLENYKTTPKQYIIEARIQLARQMLRESHLSITDISFQCGFSSTYHFCRTFKSHAGLSPSEYRMRYGSEGI